MIVRLNRVVVQPGVVRLLDLPRWEILIVIMTMMTMNKENKTSLQEEKSRTSPPPPPTPNFHLICFRNC
jgi:hypothetical protein